MTVPAARCARMRRTSRVRDNQATTPLMITNGIPMLAGFTIPMSTTTRRPARVHQTTRWPENAEDDTAERDVVRRDRLAALVPCASAALVHPQMSCTSPRCSLRGA
jgi:hypothetical protein